MFDALGIVVADMGRSLAFYRALGLDVPSEADGEGHVEYELPSGFRLMWDTREIVRSFDPGLAPSPDPSSAPAPTMGLAFRLPDAAEVDQRYADLTATGYRSHLAPFDAVWGQRYAVVVDPDGHHVDLYAPLAVDTVTGGG